MGISLRSREQMAFHTCFGFFLSLSLYSVTSLINYCRRCQENNMTIWKIEANQMFSRLISIVKPANLDVVNRQHQWRKKVTIKLTFEMLWTAYKFNARKHRDAAWQQYGKASYLHASLLTGSRTSLIPSCEWPAT